MDLIALDNPKFSYIHFMRFVFSIPNNTSL